VTRIWSLAKLEIERQWLLFNQTERACLPSSTTKWAIAVTKPLLNLIPTWKPFTMCHHYLQFQLSIPQINLSVGRISIRVGTVTIRKKTMKRFSHFWLGSSADKKFSSSGKRRGKWPRKIKRLDTTAEKTWPITDSDITGDSYLRNKCNW